MLSGPRGPTGVLAGLAALAISCGEPGESQLLTPSAPEPLVQPSYIAQGEPCVATPSPPVQLGRLDLQLTIGVGSAAASPSTTAVAPSGREYAMSFFGFYVAELALFDSTGNVSPATLLAPDGSSQPYGVHVVDAAQTATQVLRLAVNPGQYAGLILSIGMPEACRKLDPHQQVYPLSGETGMTWDWAGYLHLRFEGSVRERASLQPQLVAHHLFQDMNFTQVVLRGPLAVDQQPGLAALWLDLDRMLEPPAPPAAPSAHGFEGWIMDNLVANQGLALK